MSFQLLVQGVVKWDWYKGAIIIPTVLLHVDQFTWGAWNPKIMTAENEGMFSTHVSVVTVTVTMLMQRELLPFVFDVGSG